jgi:oxygen-independent coproporphyrinogen-3 oxidase
VCRHTELYWTGGEYAGIGCAAHGHTDGRRWWNVRTPERYIAAIDAGATAETGDERLDDATRAEEAFALALRTRRGAVAAAAAGPAVAELEAQDLVERQGERVVLTVRGRLLASDITARLLLAGAATGVPAAATPPARPAGSLALGSIEC